MRKTAIFGILALALTAGTALAHNYTLHYTHFLTLGMPAQAQGKDVARVTARVGILAVAGFGPGVPHMHYPVTPYWAAEQGVTLAKQGDHFFGKAQLNATEIPGGAKLTSVMAEFTLTFTDGSTLTLRAAPLHVTRNHNTSGSDDYFRALNEEMAAFNAATDATESSVASVSLFTKDMGY